MSLAAINVETFRSCAAKSAKASPTSCCAFFFFFFFFFGFSSLFLEAKPPQRYLRFLSHFLICFKIFFPILSFFFQSRHPIKTFMSTPTHLDKKSTTAICVSQNDKVGRRENETTYLDPEAQTCPALVPVSNSVVPEAQMCPALASVLASLSPILGLCLGGLFLRRQHPPPSCWYLTNYIDPIVSIDLS